MSRTTEQQLETLIARINKVLGEPSSPYKNIDGKFQAQVGCYLLDMSGGSYRLNRIACTSGSESHVLYGASKAVLWDQLHALLIGIDLGQKLGGVK